MLGKVTVIAFHRAKQGKEDDLRAALLALCDPTRAEKGCINYDLHVSADDPDLLVFHENWVSKDNLDVRLASPRLASPHIDAFREIAPDLLADPPNITLWSEA